MLHEKQVLNSVIAIVPASGVQYLVSYNRGTVKRQRIVAWSIKVSSLGNGDAIHSAHPVTAARSVSSSESVFAVLYSDGTVEDSHGGNWTDVDTWASDNAHATQRAMQRANFTVNGEVA
jgi:hypothetical protein